eukprot:scaffold219967_cov40-Cyclotella_meneghiniana.AAC.2
MSFCGSVFKHCTSVPLFTSEHSDGTTTIHIGEHPNWTWLAWGAGRKVGATTGTSTRQTRTSSSRSTGTSRASTNQRGSSTPRPTVNSRPASNARPSTNSRRVSQAAAISRAQSWASRRNRVSLVEGLTRNDQDSPSRRNRAIQRRTSPRRNRVSLVEGLTRNDQDIPSRNRAIQRRTSPRRQNR